MTPPRAEYVVENAICVLLYAYRDNYLSILVLHAVLVREKTPSSVFKRKTPLGIIITAKRCQSEETINFGKHVKSRISPLPPWSCKQNAFAKRSQNTFP